MPIPSVNELRVLEALAMMPFLDSTELASLANLPSSTTADVLKRFHANSLMEFVRHSRSGTSRVRRWCLTPGGLSELAASRLRGESPETLLRELPVSAQDRRYVLRRLDAAAVLYGVARDATANGRGPIRWWWSRSGGLDAAMQLADGRTLGLSRLGTTHSTQALRSRVRTLGAMHERRQLQASLLIVPGPVEVNTALNLIPERHMIFVAAEQDVLNASADPAPWQMTSGTRRSLDDVLRWAPVSDMPRTRQSVQRLTMPAERLSDDADELDMATTALTIPARRVLRLLWDCPFIRVSQLQAMMGVSEGHLRRAVGLLSRLELAHHLRIGRTAAQRHANESRLCLSGDGLRYLSRVDRSSLQDMNHHWLVTPHTGGDEAYRVPHHLIEGKKGRVLLKERRHTDGVYAFTSLLTASCRDTGNWEIVQLLSAHGWEKRYRYGMRGSRDYADIWRVIKPDATMMLRHSGRDISLVLEFERSATVPARMGPKFDRYRNYYSSSDTAIDFPDGRPGVLFVFDKREDASRFAVYASRDGGGKMPMLVSSLDDLRTVGIFGRSWLMPWRLESGHQPLDALTT